MAKTFCNIPIFVPHEACPFQCLFCDQTNISGASQKPSEDEIHQTIISYLNTLPPNCRTEVAFFGGNFTAIPLSDQEKYLSIVAPYIDKGAIQGIRLSTRPDAIDDERLSLLKKYHVKTIELGAQSMNDNVLKLSGRGHTAEDIRVASEKIKAFGFKLGLQMMIGLPGDTLKFAESTAKEIIESGADCTRIYPTLVIQGTGLEQMYQKGLYTPLSLDTATIWSAKLVQLFEAANVNVIRLGLHPSEGLRDGNTMIDGPFHPAFRELVLTQIWRDILVQNIKKTNLKNINIYTSPKERNYAIGHKASNKKMLSEKFMEIRFIADNLLKNREVRIDYY